MDWVLYPSKTFLLSKASIDMERFLLNVKNDSLAFIILVSLILGLIYSFTKLGKSNSTANFLKTDSIPALIIAGLGIPALIDLIKVGGFATFFSVVQLIILLFVIVNAACAIVNTNFRAKSSKWIKQLFVLLILGGFFTAGYLAYVEILAQPAICGVEYSGCTTVQTSRYALLLGFMPVALLGVLGYLAILVVWLARHSQINNRFPSIAYFQWGLVLFGVIFSTYLTYLEVFVIHATCSWCITSAVIMNLLLHISTLDLNVYLQAKEIELEEQSEIFED